MGTLDRVDQGSPVQVVGSSRFDIVYIALHNITVLSQGQTSESASKLYVLDLSLRNDGRRALSLGNLSLVTLISYSDRGEIFSPHTRYLQNGNEDLLLPCTLAPGQEKRGTVTYEIPGSVKSMALYAKSPNWTFLGELFIPDISNGSQSSLGAEYPKNIGMTPHSAVRSGTLLGMGPLASGNKFAVINVSITNHGTADARIKRENLFILTERGITLEHGGEREEEEVARQFLRFPLVIQPGETRTGPILYIVSPGTRVNKLVLTDRNFVINSIVDLNSIYRYELV